MKHVLYFTVGFLVLCASLLLGGLVYWAYGFLPEWSFVAFLGACFASVFCYSVGRTIFEPDWLDNEFEEVEE